MALAFDLVQYASRLPLAAGLAPCTPTPRCWRQGQHRAVAQLLVRPSQVRTSDVFVDQSEEVPLPDQVRTRGLHRRGDACRSQADRHRVTIAPANTCRTCRCRTTDTSDIIWAPFDGHFRTSTGIRLCLTPPLTPAPDTSIHIAWCQARPHCCVPRRVLPVPLFVKRRSWVRVPQAALRHEKAWFSRPFSLSGSP